MGIQEKLEKAAELEALAAKLRAEVEAETPKKWHPRTSSYLIDCDGDVVDYEDNEVTRSVTSFGAGRLTREQATKDAKRMRQFNRLLCWLIEQGWDDDMCVHADVDGHVSIVFYESEKFSRDLMYGIAHGVIEL